ncbi:PadR family transcriptional regulator [Virgibacillus sp. NKC19-16]|uniref:PadR family transcriptional regulator n=1 Tax=Virgibacillus salidurans TaxID=2831673 RepID=UPI001F476C6D|nr:PadR family transcriptional regulator [Virgibacillus sp. NKC19-16]UJL46382.1 PadR family transcriptional regulator [Virgibacillus sp. NKC19-16]
MPRNDSIEMGELTDSAYYILLSLVDAKHGYVVMQTIEEMTDNRLSIGPASMYTIIKKLLAADLIKQVGDKDKKRKTYVATEKGLELLKKEVERRREMVRHAEKILHQKEREIN